MRKWKINEFRKHVDLCPLCKKQTESYSDDEENGFTYAERCPHCRWQINFFPTPKKVAYGSQPNTNRRRR
jgi:ssDNA-binding Zn-finger/Zn-ribbon topoisomerase 1